MGHDQCDARGDRRCRADGCGRAPRRLRGDRRGVVDRRWHRGRRRPHALDLGSSGRPPSRPAPRRPPPTTPTPTPTPTLTPTPSQTPTTSPTPKPTATKKPRTTLVRGDSGPKVLALQQRLTALGYWLGAPDGKFGSLTQQAVWAFQKSAGLRRDGVVGPKTLKALAAGIPPRATLSGNGVEIDLDRQILLVVRGGRCAPSSTPRPAAARSTPRPRATAPSPSRRAAASPSTAPSTTRSPTRWASSGGRASSTAASRCTARGNIPPWPDSHGCARLSNAAIDMIWAADLMPIGSRVVVR